MSNTPPKNSYFPAKMSNKEREKGKSHMQVYVDRPYPLPRTEQHMSGSPLKDFYSPPKMSNKKPMKGGFYGQMSVMYVDEPYSLPKMQHKEDKKVYTDIGQSIIFADGSEDMHSLRIKGPPLPVCRPRSANGGSDTSSQRGIIARLNSLRQGGNGSGSSRGMGNWQDGGESFVVLKEEHYVPELSTALPESVVDVSSGRRSRGGYRGAQEMDRRQMLSENPKAGTSTKPSSTTGKANQASGLFQRTLSNDEKRRKEEFLQKWNSKADRRFATPTPLPIEHQGEQEEDYEALEQTIFYSVHSTMATSLDDLLRVEKRKEDDKKANEGLENMWGMEPSLVRVHGFGVDVDGEEENGEIEMNKESKERSGRRRLSFVPVGVRNGKGGFKMGSLGSGREEK